MRAHLVSGGEEEQIEEHDLDERRNRHANLADQHPGKQRSDDVAQAERAEAEPANQEADSQRQKQCQLGILSEGCDKGGHWSSLNATGV